MHCLRSSPHPHLGFAVPEICIEMYPGVWSRSSMEVFVGFAVEVHLLLSPFPFPCLGARSSSTAVNPFESGVCNNLGGCVPVGTRILQKR